MRSTQALPRRRPPTSLIPVRADISHKAISPIRIGLCGIGRSGFGMVKRELADRQDVRVVAGFDLIRERSQELAGLLGSAVCTDYRQMLRDPAIELVIVATRSHEHVPMAIEALEAGKHVLVEKPMALSVREADRLIAAKADCPGELFVRHNRRFDAPFLQAMEIVRSGKLGKIFSIQLRQMSFGRRADWQTLRKFGGGQLLNWGPHLIDWGLQLMGSPAKEVWSDLRLIAAAGDAEDHAKLMIRGENGIVVDIEISGAAAISEPGWIIQGSTGAMKIDGNKVQVKYFDPKALPSLRVDSSTPTNYASRNGEEIKWIEENFEVAPQPAGNYWAALHATLRDGKVFPITLGQARETMRVIELAKRGTPFATLDA
jgi:predicted dehydrogenase